MGPQLRRSTEVSFCDDWCLMQSVLRRVTCNDDDPVWQMCTFHSLGISSNVKHLGGSSWTLTPKVTLESHCTKRQHSKTKGSVALGKESEPDIAAQPPDHENSGVPNVNFLPQILEPCSSGAPSKRRICWNYNACSTELTSSSRTWVRMGQLQQGATQQTTSRTCRARSTPLHAKWMLWAAVAAQKPQRASYPRVTTSTPGLVACEVPTVRKHPSGSQCLQRCQPNRDAPHPSPSLRRHVLLL